ncbi:MAG: NAD(+) diphosphatase [Pseudomonadota bacterium]
MEKPSAPSGANVFAGAHIPRKGPRRGDAAWLASAFASDRARFVPVWKNKSLTREGDGAALLTADAMGALLPPADRAVFLGNVGGRLCFAVDVGVDAEPAFAGCRFRSLRTIGAVLGAEEAALMAYAQAMVLWHRRHGHCSNCGARTTPGQGGHLRTCNDPACGAAQHPRTDAAVIVLASRGDRALLGRQPTWPEGLYSTIAGFVEPGESLEEAVTREVFEETGILVQDPVYHSSQPWPFPSSLMVGFHARATNDAIRLRDKELEDARWFSRDEVAAMVARQAGLPSSISIAFRLIEQWYDRGEPGALRALATGPRHRA